MYRFADGLFLESLEARIAPAAVAMYTDIDGDVVRVTSSKGTSEALQAIVNAGLASHDPGQASQLHTLDFSANEDFAGTNIKIAVRGKALGDGFANLGYLNATGIDLGSVGIKGDLGQITAGSNTAGKNALKGLTLDSMGAFGLETGAVGIESQVAGSIGSVKVKGDVSGVYLHLFNAEAASTYGIKSVSIGGDLVGGEVQFAGAIGVSGSLGKVRVGGSILGDDGQFSGNITAAQGIGSLTVGESVKGGVGQNSGYVFATGQSLGPVKIGGDLQGGSALNSGFIGSGQGITSVTIGGSLLGGTADRTGWITAGQKLGNVKIGGDFEGGATGSAFIQGTQGIGAISITGSVLGTEAQTARILADHGGIASIRIGGDFAAGTGTQSAFIETKDNGTIGPVTIGGAMTGSAAASTASILSSGSIGAVKIGKDLTGLGGDHSGSVQSTNGGIASISIGGKFSGGTAANSGLISSKADLGKVTIGSDVDGGTIIGQAGIAGVSIGGSLIGKGIDNSGGIHSAGNLGAVSIVGDVTGGSGKQTGVIESLGALFSVKIGGSLVGGTANNTGQISALGPAGSVFIGSDVEGGSITGTTSLLNSGSLYFAGHVGSVRVDGSVIAGTNDGTGGATLIGSGSIVSGRDFGSIRIGGDLVGSSGTGGVTRAIISAYGENVATFTNVAIGSLSVGGNVEKASVLAGYSYNATTGALTANGPGAQIGAVKVGLDWVASNLVAGAQNSGFPNFGNANDSLIPNAKTVARIASIVIGGDVVGSADANDHFGFVAQEIGSLKVGGSTITLAPAESFTDLAADTTVHLLKAPEPPAP
jgi:hypothetical protein